MANKLLEKTAKLPCLYTLSFVGLNLSFGGEQPVARQPPMRSEKDNRIIKPQYFALA